MSDNQTYMLDASGKLHRLGNHIATLNEKDELVFHDPTDRSKYAGPVSKWLKDELARREDAKKAAETTPPRGGDGTNQLDSPDKLEAGMPPAPPKPIDEKQRAAQEAQSLAAEGARESAKYQADVQDDEAFARANGCPPPPKKNPMFGDKTPNYVEWLHQYRNDKWREKYGVKGKGQVPVFKTNAEGVEEHVGYREADMANRKTHMTEKIEDTAGLASDQSWDA